MEAMDHEDAILNASFVYSEQEVLSEFQESCEAEAETPGRCADRLKLAVEDPPQTGGVSV